MKIIPAHFEYMKVEISKALRHKSIEDCREFLRSDLRVKDLEKRLRWDLLHAAGLTPWICKNLYGYVDDSHIDTALKRIVAELETEQFSLADAT
jgi:O-methyltransferase involved in polyketide biosynthesis